MKTGMRLISRRARAGWVVAFAMMAALLLGLPARADDRYWVATAGGNWNNTANWADGSGGTPGASVPVATDTAIFDGGGSGDCDLDAVINVLGLRLEAGFMGTVRQTDKTLTIGNGGYAQTNGVFVGGTADITISGSTLSQGFVLAGGTFTNTSGVLSIARTASGDCTIFTFSGGSFAHNNGTVRLFSNWATASSGTHTLALRRPLSLKHIEYTGGVNHYLNQVTYSLDLAETGALTVEGDFTIQRHDGSANRRLRAHNGMIDILGNVAVGPGAIEGTTLLRVKGTGNQTYTSTGGGRLPYLKIDKPAGSSFSPSGSSGSDLLAVRLDLTSGTFVAPTGVLDLARGSFGAFTNFSFTGGVYDHNGGTLRLASAYGSNGQGYHTISLRRPLTLNHLVYTGGNANNPSQNYDHHWVLDLAESGAMVVNGDFSMQRNDTSAGRELVADGGEIHLRGNVAAGAGAVGGTTWLIVDGTNDQHYAATAGGRLPRVKVDKSSGSFTAADGFGGGLYVSAFELAAGAFVAPTGQLNIVNCRPAISSDFIDATVFAYTGGTFDHNGGTLRLATKSSAAYTRTHTVSLRQPLTLNHLVYTGGTLHYLHHLRYALDPAGLGALTVAGDFRMEREFETDAHRVAALNGMIEVQGGVRIGTGAFGGTSAVKLSGPNEQVLTHIGGTPPQGLWTVDKTDGAAVLATDVALTGASQDLVWTNGVLNVSSNTLAVGRNVVIGPEATRFSVTVADETRAGRLTVSGTVSGIENAELIITVRPRASELEGRAFTILSNASVLSGTFAPVTWRDGPRGKVDYTENGGRNVVLKEFRPSGSVIMIR